MAADSLGWWALLHNFVVVCPPCVQELAVLDLVATAVEHKGDGHCRTLLQALEGWLGPELGVAKLVAVCPADVSGAHQRAPCCFLLAEDIGCTTAWRDQHPGF
jgi:hypothetical protein